MRLSLLLELFRLLLIDFEDLKSVLVKLCHIRYHLFIELFIKLLVYIIIVFVYLNN